MKKIIRSLLDLSCRRLGLKNDVAVSYDYNCPQQQDGFICGAVAVLRMAAIVGDHLFQHTATDMVGEEGLELFDSDWFDNSNMERDHPYFFNNKNCFEKRARPQFFQVNLASDLWCMSGNFPPLPEPELAYFVCIM